MCSNSIEILENSHQDLIKAIESNNINIDNIAKAYMTLSDIYLSQNKLINADRAIKKALRANKKIVGIIEKLRTINNLKLQNLGNPI